MTAPAPRPIGRRLTALLMPLVVIATTRCQSDPTAVEPVPAESTTARAPRPLLATVSVGDVTDGGPGSLRQAIAAAAPGDVIDLTGLSGTIVLTSGELTIDKDLTIVGPGANVLTISRLGAAPAFRIFNVTAGTVTISGVTISGGVSGTGGGGVRVANATLTLSDCAVTGNTVNSLGFGGGLTFFHATGTIDRCTISGNSAQSIASGAGLTVNTSVVTLVNSTVSGNTAGTGGGGGITITSDLPAATSTATLVHSTVAANTASGDGNAGIYLFGSGLEVLNLTGSLVADNGIDLKIPFPSGGEQVNATTSLVEVPGANVSIPAGQVGDPKLAALADNGGPTKTHALLAGSPAIGAGTPASCTAPPVSGIDQRGKLRPDACSLGAYEANPVAPPPSSGGTVTIKVPGSINVKATGNGGIVTVSVLSTASFNAPASVDPATATLGSGGSATVGVAKKNNGTLMTSVADVNGDGLPDLTLQFRRNELIQAGAITPTTTQLVLRATLVDGVTTIEGSAPVKIVP